jgi:hypothetical protein
MTLCISLSGSLLQVETIEVRKRNIQYQAARRGDSLAAYSHSASLIG